ncbi:MAG: hypothetical protein GPJ29_20340 [Microcystis aeruginosa BK11-02]|nr:hypothetical protein [Microcystis aeruginosa BK11-02]
MTDCYHLFKTGFSITGQCGGVNCAAMRKRGQRAKEKLKTIFGKILEEQGSF